MLELALSWVPELLLSVCAGREDGSVAREMRREGRGTPSVDSWQVSVREPGLSMARRSCWEGG